MAALGLILCGCGKEELPPVEGGATTVPSQNSSNIGTSGTITESDLDVVPKASKPYKMVLIVKTKNNPFFIPMINEFEAEAKVLDVEAEVQAAAEESSYEQQVALIQTEVLKGAQAILITPADSKALVPALKKAADAGVLIINLDNRLDAETVKSQRLQTGGYVGADNMIGGEKAGAALLEAVGGVGKVAIIEGIRGVDNAEARKKGFELAVGQRLKIVAHETGEWETEKAYNKTLAIIAAHPDLKGIFCANDNMALGTMKAIAEKGKKGQIKVVGYDHIPDVQASLLSGDLYATIEQHPDRMGKYGVRMAVGILDGSIRRGGELLVTLETVKK